MLSLLVCAATLRIVARNATISTLAVARAIRGAATGAMTIANRKITDGVGVMITQGVMVSKGEIVDGGNTPTTSAT